MHPEDYNRELTRKRVERARRMRKEPSAAEDIAWKIIRKGQSGFKWRRQHAIGPYVLDFYCAEARLALEFDGEQHNPERDKVRDEWMAAKGIRTVRIPNREFFRIDPEINHWLQDVVEICEERTGRRWHEKPRRERGT